MSNKLIFCVILITMALITFTYSANNKKIISDIKSTISGKILFTFDD